jgi:hypothetical protein
MASYKRVDGDYTIENTLEPDGVTYTGNVIINCGNLEINTNDGGIGNVDIAGNLNVGGNVTYINVEELNIRDPFILLNSSNTGTYASNSGILTHKTSTTFAGLRYDNLSGEWQISIDTNVYGNSGSWGNLVTGSVVRNAAGSNTQVQFNTGGNFDASANLVFDKSINQLALQGHAVFGNLGAAPTAVANSVALYHNTVGAGETGLYALDDARNEELISKRKAVVYSLIL